MSAKIRIAAIGDLHMQQGLSGNYYQMFESISQNADILLICGDLTANGFTNEAKMLAEELTPCKIPILGVLGNHDYANGQQHEIKEILSPQVFFLDNQLYTYKQIGFAGAKGFGGGFNKHLLTPFGEGVLKQFVYEAVSETMKLHEALVRLETSKKVVVLHYAPIRQTLEGEYLEVYPFLGTSRLLEPIENFNVTAVFHGHAHHGSPVSKTPKGIPVYNVAFPLLERINPNQPYKIVEI